VSAEADVVRKTGELWVGSVVIDCSDLPRMIAFWQAALGYIPRDPPEPDGVVLTDPSGRGPNVSLNLTSEAPLTDYRIHLDLYSSRPEEEVQRLLGLGATVERSAKNGQDFVTLADPDGNLFDVIDKRGWSSGRRA
jgi:catechol 2,3-dioxygenase-like lactoylglutathione lyase family enzyme